MEPIRKITLPDQSEFRLFQDEFPVDPRSNDGNLCEFIFWLNEYSGYTVGDDHGFENPAELKDTITDNDYIFPVRAYIHGGIALSLGNSYPFNCQWDSGYIGYAVIRADKVAEFGLKPIDAKKTYENAENELAVYNSYLSGDTYGYSIVEFKTCDCCGNVEETVTDSWWGFYGQDFHNNGLSDQIPNEFKNLILDGIK